MRASELSGRTVMDISSATSVGTVVAPILDAEAHRVVGFRVKGAAGPVLPWSGVSAVGADAVTVAGPDAVRQATTDPELRAANGSIDPLGIRVLDEDGFDLGVVDDIEFDVSTGAIAEIVVSGTSRSGDELLGIGDYALVLRAEQASGR